MNSNFSSPEDRELEALLRAAQPPLADDDAFVQRVMHALPPTRGTAPRTGSARAIVCMVGGAIGLGIASAQIASLGGFAAVREQMAQATFDAAASLAQLDSFSLQPAPLSLALVVCAASLFYAFKPSLR